MSWIREFKEFAMRGNVVDMAVGVIIGTAFGKITASLVHDVIMPPIGVLLSGVDFSNLKLALGGAAANGEPVAIRYGLFISTVIDFIIVALVVFLVIKGINVMRRKQPETAAPTTKTCPECLSSIPLAARRCAQCTSAVV